MRRETRVIARVDASDDEGNGYVVVEYQEFMEIQTLGNPAQWIKGMKSIELDDGSPVNFRDDNTFEIVMTGTIVRKRG